MLETRSFARQARNQMIAVALLPALLGLLFFTLAAKASDVTPVSSISGAPLAWSHDLPRSLSDAQRDHKLVLVDVYTDWCGWCKRLDRDTYSDPSVISFLNSGYVPVKIDAEDGGAGQAFAQKYRVRAFPAILVLDASGRKVGEFYGYKNAQDFPAAIRDISGR